MKLFLAMGKAMIAMLFSAALLYGYWKACDLVDRLCGIRGVWLLGAVSMLALLTFWFYLNQEWNS